MVESVTMVKLIYKILILIFNNNYLFLNEFIKVLTKKLVEFLTILRMLLIIKFH